MLSQIIFFCCLELEIIQSYLLLDVESDFLGHLIVYEMVIRFPWCIAIYSSIRLQATYEDYASGQASCNPALVALWLP